MPANAVLGGWMHMITRLAPAPPTEPAATPAALNTVAQVLNGLGIALCAFDGADRTTLWNQAFLRFFPEHDGQICMGETYADILRRFCRTRLLPADLPRIERFVTEGVARHHAQTRPFQFHHRGKRLTAASLPFASGGCLRIWTAPAADAAVSRPNLAPLPDTLFNMADGAAMLDKHGRITGVNGDFMRLYDLPSATDALGLTLGELVGRAWKQQSPSGVVPGSLPVLDDSRRLGVPFEVELPGGRWRRVMERRAADGSTYASHGDITVLKQQQIALQKAYAQLEALAVTDSLTGIPNRRRFEQALSQAVAASARTMAPLSLLLLDVDNFKRINDVHGHPAGDGCLQRLASLLRRAVRVGDVPARLGGDEFALILPGAGYDDARDVAEMLRAASAADMGGPAMTVSIGVASLDGAADSGAGLSLVAAADRALYAAKRAGRDRVCSPA